MASLNSNQKSTASKAEGIEPQTGSVIEVNIGGQVFSTCSETFAKYPESLLGLVFSTSVDSVPLLKDTRGRYFIDRDGNLFRFILDFMRNDKLVLPEDFSEKHRLIEEASYYRLPGLVKSVENQSEPKSVRFQSDVNGHDLCEDFNSPTKEGNELDQAGDISEGAKARGGTGFITVGYRGTFAFGRDGLADVQFRKVIRILVHGKVSLCREVFGNSLNESRDPDRGSTERYSSRFFLKYNSLEQAFDQLAVRGFVLSASTACSANGVSMTSDCESEENRWMHYTEFTFYRP